MLVIKVPADSVAGEGLVPGSQMPVAAAFSPGNRKGTPLGSLYKVTNPIPQGSTCMT